MVTTNIIVAFPKIEDARNIKAVLGRSGFTVSTSCTSGAHVLNAVDSLDGGIVVCGYRLTDMLYSDLHQCLPSQFKILLVASEGHWSERDNSDVVFIPMPLKVHALTETLNMMIETQMIQRRQKRQKPRVRNEEELILIRDAKRLLMDKNNMTEDEAHRYIQKCSMDSGNSMVETAGMVLSIYG
ncbi:MAG: ANTAR domain-containing protein [Thermoflexaceae bacterium]|nr:ANTAR domain-containing protein [Thermoflexaceae bacterium]